MARDTVHAVKRVGIGPPDERPPAYDVLRHRALAALRATAGSLADAELAAAMFGSTSGAASRLLVRAILAGDARFSEDDGRWTLASKSFQERDRSTASILALALATTGADPRRHRIVRLALVCLHDDQITARLDTPIRPDTHLPSYLQTATRTSRDDLEAAPSFAEAYAQLVELVGTQDVHAYGARRTAEFLDVEATRASLPRLHIQFIEADTQVRPLLPRRTKPGLLAAARELAVAYPSPGVPLSDAETLARVLHRVRARAQVAPPRADSAAEDRAHPGSNDEGKQQLPFTRAWLDGVPDWPGVYLLKDRRGSVLYVGKAVSLNRRLANYIQRQPSANRQFEALAVRAVEAETIAMPSDLEATLLEARLIREYAPDFNVAKVVRLPRTILRAGLDDPSPRLQLVTETRPDGARYFGPLASSRLAQAALDTVRAVYPDAVARRRGDAATQRAAVLDACRLLAGQASTTISILQDAMRSAASRGDRVELDRLRATLRDVQRLDMTPSVLMGLRVDAELLILEYVQDGVTRAHLIRNGTRIVSVSWGIDYLPSNPSSLRELADAMLAATEAGQACDDNGDISAPLGSPHPDEPAMVMRWLLQARTRIQMARVPHDQE